MTDNISIVQKDITDRVSQRVQQLQNDGLQLPVNYNASNALKSAWFAIQKVQDRNKRPALEVATKDSIAKSLLDMVIQGLSPAKTQAYFLVRGNELQMERSYFGTQAVVKRLSEVSDIWAEVIHEGDDFEIGSKEGRLIVTKFEPKFVNQDKPLIGAFAAVKKADGEIVYTVMTKNEIDTAWSHRQNSGNVQKEFPQEMAKRTVINRAAKNFINTSDDSDLLAQAINTTTANEFDNDQRKDVTQTSGTANKLATIIGGTNHATNDVRESETESEPEIIESTKQDDPKEIEGAVEQSELL